MRKAAAIWAYSSQLLNIPDGHIAQRMASIVDHATTATRLLLLAYEHNTWILAVGHAVGQADPPIDFAKEAEAAGAYGENVTDSAQVEGALRRGLKAIREEGRPAVISVWLAKLMQKD